MTDILFWGSEDSDFVEVGAVSVDTTSGQFTPTVACGLVVPTAIYAPLSSFWRCIEQFTSAGFWVSAWMWTNATAPLTSAGAESTFLLRLLDSNGVPRLAILNDGGDEVNSNTGPWAVYTVSAEGVYTILPGTQFTGLFPDILQNIAVYWSPSLITVKINGALIVQYAGDVTTDGVGVLGGFDLGEPLQAGGAGSPTGITEWSGAIVSDFDPTSMQLLKLPITGAGATSTWNGEANGSTINQITLDVTTGIDTATPGETELFTSPGTLPSGSWSILGVGVGAYAAAAPIPPPFTLVTNADTPSGATLSFASTAGVYDGAIVTGTNIATDSAVLSFVPNTSVTLNNAISGDVPSGETITFTSIPAPQHIIMATHIGSETYSGPSTKPGPSLNRQSNFWYLSPATNELFSTGELSSLQVGIVSVS